MKIKMTGKFQDVYLNLAELTSGFFDKFILYMLLLFKIVIWTYSSSSSSA